MFWNKKNRKNEMVDVEQLKRNLANASRLRDEMYTMSVSFTDSTNSMLASSRKEIKRV